MSASTSTPGNAQGLRALGPLGGLVLGGGISTPPVYRRFAVAFSGPQIDDKSSMQFELHLAFCFWQGAHDHDQDAQASRAPMHHTAHITELNAHDLMRNLGPLRGLLRGYARALVSGCSRAGAASGGASHSCTASKVDSSHPSTCPCHFCILCHDHLCQDSSLGPLVEPSVLSCLSALPLRWQTTESPQSSSCQSTSTAGTCTRLPLVPLETAARTWRSWSQCDETFVKCPSVAFSASNARS